MGLYDQTLQYEIIFFGNNPRYSASRAREVTRMFKCLYNFLLQKLSHVLVDQNGLLLRNNYAKLGCMHPQIGNYFQLNLI